MYVLGFQNAARTVHWRAKLTGGHPGDAFSEFQREKRDGAYNTSKPVDPEAEECLQAGVTLEYRKD